MDPIATIKEMREFAEIILAEGVWGTVSLDNVAHFAELFQALDKWRLDGGFDPWEVKS